MDANIQERILSLKVQDLTPEKLDELGIPYRTLTEGDLPPIVWELLQKAKNCHRRGQPPKDPSEVKRNVTIMLSSSDRELIESACRKSGEKFGPFIRDAALNKAAQIHRES